MSEEIKIESGIPIPDKITSKGRPARIADASAAMNVGDSIFFKKMSAAYYASMKLRKIGKRPSVRRVEGGFRVWRVA